MKSWKTWNHTFSAKQRLINSLGKFRLAVITIDTFTRGIQKLPINNRARNLKIRRKRVHVKSYLGEEVRVTFCLKSLAAQGGSVKTLNVATERLAKNDELNENKIDR